MKNRIQESVFKATEMLLIHSQVSQSNTVLLEFSKIQLPSGKSERAYRDGFNEGETIYVEV